MALLRKKKSTFDESDLPTDNWIWGNTRGGGGAPLKDVQGNDVTNLKKVLAGTIEVDHSPSPNSKSRRNHHSNRNSDYDDQVDGYGQNNRNKSNHRGGDNRNRPVYDQDDYDDQDYDRRGGRNNSSQRNNSNYNNHPSSQSSHNAPYNARNNQNNPSNRDNSRDNNQNMRFNPYSDDAPERIIPGLNDHHSHNNNNYNNHSYHAQRNSAPSELPSPRHVHNNNGVSPKKFMGALRELNGGGNGERDAKQRKQAEYQEMLRQQIEEKNKKKEKEKRELEEVKRRELAEFMATQPGNKGKQPSAAVSGGNSEPDYPPPKKTVPRFRADSDDEYNNNNNRGGGGGNKIPGLNIGGGGGNNKGRGGGGNGGGYSDEEPEPPRQQRRNEGYDGRRNNPPNNNRGRANSYDSQDSDYDYDYRSDDSRGRDRGGAGGGGRGGGGARSSAADVVPVEEYDELSKLVDRLLTEKAQLQLAVDKQADQLKALKGGKGGAAAPRSRLAGSPSKQPPAIARSKSAIQPRERDRGYNGSAAGDTASEEPPRAASNLRVSKKELDRERARETKASLKQYEPLSKNARNAAAANKARPSSMHAMGGKGAYQDETGAPKKAVKVAFGSNRNLDKNNMGPSRLAQQGAAVVKGGARKAESPTKGKDNTGQGRYGSQAQQPKRVGGGGMGERDNIGINGFAKLQQAHSRVVGGPVMVVHDEEEPSSRYNNARTPSPLRGGGRGGARGLELRGNSEYIPISDDRDYMGGDQLEKLLRQSRNAR